MSDLGIRLKEERERLGMSQDDFASLAGMKKNAQLNYEKGLRTPDAKYLTAIHAKGADILYITTGKRQEISAPMYGVIDDLSDVGEEKSDYNQGLSPVAEMVSLFEKSSPRLQRAVLALLRAK